MDDRMLEVVGLYSSFHVGRIQISASEPVRIGQSSNVKIVINESVPVHIDGEPWEQSGPSVIDINHQGQAYMLKKV
jgi:diacylglycerol kinase (ATP)